MNPNRTQTTLNPYQMNPGRIQGPNHPPKKQTMVNEDIRIMLEYSPKKKRANPMAEYSVK